MSELTVQEREAMAGVVRLLRRVRERVQREREEAVGPVPADPGAVESLKSSETLPSESFFTRIYSKSNQPRPQISTPSREREVCE